MKKMISTSMTSGAVGKKMISTLMISGAVVCTALPASAMEVKVSGDPCTLTVFSSQTSDAQAQELPAEDFFIYGRIGADQAVVRVGDTVGFADVPEILSKFPEVPADSLPDGSGLTDVNNGMNGDAAKDIQQKLIDLGYLTGTADGMYGGGTAGAVKEFQEKHGLTGSGNADVNTQMVLQALADGLPEVLETTYPLNISPESKFSAIQDLTDEDLTRFAGTEWRFSYDAFEKFGMLDPQIVIGSFSDESSDINRISLTASFKVVVKENVESGRLELTPCLVVESTGAYRPYLQAAILSSGGQTVQIDGGESRGALSGVTMTETGYIPLTSEAMSLLQGGLNSVRISGMNNTYDISNMADTGRLSWFAENA